MEVIHEHAKRYRYGLGTGYLREVRTPCPRVRELAIRPPGRATTRERGEQTSMVCMGLLPISHERGRNACEALVSRPASNRMAVIGQGIDTGASAFEGGRVQLNGSQ